MSHRNHEARIRALGASELEQAAGRLRSILMNYQELGVHDIGNILTPWEMKLREAAKDERAKSTALYDTPNNP